MRFGDALRRQERFGEDMYLPLIAFAIFAGILFTIGLVAGRAADRNAAREVKEREHAA